MVNTSMSATERLVGEDLVKAALILQACLFLSFIALAAVFQVRAAKAGVLKPSIKRVLIVMYVSCVIVTARCIYRIVEFFQGYTGEIYTHEAYFYVFEASIMFINTAMLNVFHPGRSLPRSNKIFLAKDGVTELRGPGWKDARPKIVTFLDPFDLVGLCTGRDKKTRFWDMTPEELAVIDEQARLDREKKANEPRSIFMILLDPLHLWGSTGIIATALKKLSKDEEETTNGPVVQTKDSRTVKESV
jgi:RTA1 like protein